MAEVGFPQVQLAPVPRFATPDFSALANLPNSFWQGQEVGRENAMRKELANLPKDANGNPDWNAATAIMLKYDPKLAVASAAANKNSTVNVLDLARLNETQRHNQAIEQNYASGKNAIVQIPDENGVMQPYIYDRIGGTFTPAADKATGAGKRYRQMNPSEIDKLTTQGNNFTGLSDFAKSFQDSYGGYNIGGLIDYGKAAGTLGRMGTGTENNQEAAQWWQGYDRYKNTIRKDLYGTALTLQEQQNFEKADITPGMDPKTIRHNLAIQNAVIQRGIKRKADALAGSGYSPEAINKAYGLDTGTLEDKPIPGPNTAQQNPYPPGYKASAGEQAYPETGPRPSANDFQMLKQHANDPQFRQEFEAIYGAGSVDRWLQNDGWTGR